MNTIFTTICSAILGLHLTAVAGAHAADFWIQEEAPSKREQKKLVEEYFELDPLVETTAARRAEIVARMETVELSKPNLLKSWRKTVTRESGKSGRKLKKKSGSYWYWEEPRRGYFLIGGNTSKPKALVIGMHGGGVGSGDAGSIHNAMSSAAAKLGWLAISPEVLEKTERGWTDSGTEEWVLQLVDDAIRTWDLDLDRVYFSGHSMGGYGSWTLGAHHADRVAALAPSAGAPTPVYGPEGTIIDIDEGVVPSLFNVPMVVYQSVDDPQVPADANQAAKLAVDKAKERWGGYADFEYWEVDGRGHGYPPGGLLALLSKIEDFRRQPLPPKIVWQPRLDWKQQFYWLYWPQPVINAIVEAELDADNNSVHLRSEADLGGLQILLDERVLDLKKEITLIVNGETVAKGLAKPDLGTLLLTSAHPDPQLQFIARMGVPK